MFRRRTLIKTGIGIGAMGVMGTANAASDSQKFGEFEDGLDGWKTEDQNTLSRVDETDVGPAILIGSQSLLADVTGEPGTKIFKDSNLDSVDFREHPYLLAYVISGTVYDGDSLTDLPVDYQFKFYILNSEQDEVIALKSGTQTVPPHTPQYVSFDMSNLLAELYSTVEDESDLIPQRIEIFWEPCASDDVLSSIDYHGEVIFDDIRATSVETEYSLRALTQTRAELMDTHGQINRTSIDNRSDSLEEGTLEFSDGFTLNFTIEELSENVFEYTIERQVSDESYVIEVGN